MKTHFQEGSILKNARRPGWWLLMLPGWMKQKISSSWFNKFVWHDATHFWKQDATFLSFYFSSVSLQKLKKKTLWKCTKYENTQNPRFISSQCFCFQYANSTEINRHAGRPIEISRCNLRFSVYKSSKALCFTGLLHTSKCDAM